MDSKSLFEKYEKYKEQKLSIRRFKQAQLFEVIKKLPFEKMVIGQSFEGRDIIKIRIGEGPIPILMWSQMHGNEATATMALVDIFNFLNSKNDGFDNFRNDLLSTFTLHFIPMLNPDGSQRFVRRTAQGIDMNRDATALQCPESQLLKNQVMNLNPLFSFNLHDQGTRYSVGHTGVQAYNEAREWNENRTRARQVINSMNDVLQNYIPAGVGRYSDEFEPRAFGDNIQKWGSSLILIESGGYPNDTEKQYIRKLNFVAILTALESIMTKDYTRHTLEIYEAIPQNEKYIFDILIKNARVEHNKKSYSVSLGINIDEKNNAKATSFTQNSVIEDIGDLSVFFGLKTIDVKGGLLESFEQHPDLMQKHKLKKTDVISVEVGNRASFVIKSGNTRIACINGKILD
jgi:Zinc carboxypeptidase